jgi:hypothetical protein
MHGKTENLFYLNSDRFNIIHMIQKRNKTENLVYILLIITLLTILFVMLIIALLCFRSVAWHEYLLELSLYILAARPNLSPVPVESSEWTKGVVVSTEMDCDLKRTTL